LRRLLKVGVAVWILRWAAGELAAHHAGRQNGRPGADQE
jgi:hypothetical protein